MQKSKSVMMVILLTALALLVAACGGGSGPNGNAPGATNATGGAGAENSSQGAAPEQPTEEPAREPDKVNFAYFPAFHTMVVFVADQGGFFEKENLDVNMIYTDKGSLLPTMLIAGQADISTVDITSIAIANDQDKDLLHIYPTSQHMSMNFVADNDYLSAAGITKDSSLEDKLAVMGDMKIGITGPNSPTDIYTRFLLTKGGFDPRNVQLVSLSNAGNLLAALKSKQIDGFMLTPPTPNQPELEGYGTILIKSSAGEVPELANYPYQGITVSKKWAEANADVTARFVKALMEAGTFIQNNPDEAKDYLKSYFPDMTDDALAAGLADMIPALPQDGLLTEEFVSDYLTLNKELDILTLDDIPSAAEGILWTNEYVVKAGE